METTHPTRHRLRRGDHGNITAFAAILIIALLAAAGLVLDGAAARSAKLHAMDRAQAAARIGAQAIDLSAYRAGSRQRLDPVAADTAAATWLAHRHLTGTVHATARAVTVTVQAQRRTQLLGLLGIDQLTVTATATATAHHLSTPPQ